MTPSLIEVVDLVVKDGKNVAGSVTGLYLCGEGMGEKVGLCFFLVCFHGSDEDGAEIRVGSGRGRRLGHGNNSIKAGNQRVIASR